MAKVLVTGGAGFIGSNLSNHLVGAGYDVTVIDDLRLGKESNLSKGVKFVKANVLLPTELKKVGSGYDYIVHLAASSSAPLFESHLIDSCHNNMMGYLYVLEYARQIGVKKVLFASTSSIYGDNPPPLSEDMEVIPPNMYSVTKHNMEEVSKVYSDLYGIEIIAFRFMSVYGLHEEHKSRFANLVSQFLWTIYQGKSPVLFGDGRQTRDFTNVRDVVQGIRKGIETPKKYGFTVFNIGSTKNYSLIELIDKINLALGTKVVPRFIPSPLKWTARNQLGDLTKIETELGYEAQVDLDAGLMELVDNLPKNPNDLPDVSEIEKILTK